eukprot:gene13327-biopygen10392
MWGAPPRWAVAARGTGRWRQVLACDGSSASGVDLGRVAASRSSVRALGMAVRSFLTPGDTLVPLEPLVELAALAPLVQ